MKTAILALLLLVGCAADYTERSTASTLCTIEDQENGTCPVEDLPVAGPPSTTADAYYDTVARDSGTVTCGWDRCGSGGGYLCEGDDAACLLLRETGYIVCTVKVPGRVTCFNSDLVGCSYQCYEWKNRPRWP